MKRYTRRFFFVFLFTISSFAFASQAPLNPACASIFNFVTLTPGPGQTQIRPEDMGELTLGTYNMANFFIYAGQYERTGANTMTRVPDDSPNRRLRGQNSNGQEVKPEEDRLAIQRLMEQQIRADILALQEIESEQAIDTFAVQYLRSQYEGIARGTNDTRGIRVGSFYNRRLPIEVELRQHLDVTWRDPADNNNVHKLFSRDALVSIHRIIGYEKPFSITITSHFKSKRNRPGDPLSELLRTAQAQEVANIIRRLMQEFGTDVPIFLMADMNTDVSTGPELQPIRDLGFRDVLDIMNVPMNERVTHTYHPRGEPAHYSQMDGIFVSPNMQQFIVSAQVHRYLDEHGQPRPLPQTYEERELQASDHLALSARANFATFIAASLRSPRR